MTNQILQCCYTNASKEIAGKISSGWQAVAVSPGIPPEAYSNCIKVQNANSTIQTNMVDESGNVLNLLEIVGDGSYIYVIRTQYGLLDRLGRANMFSHAYIIPCRDSDAVVNPNSFLTIANENFKDNEDDAVQKYDTVTRIESYELRDVLNQCHLADNEYLTLIQSVYAQISEKKMAKPLYIQYDGTEENLRMMLFCIYSGLPLFMRRNLSIASVATDSAVGKNIIFTKNISKNELYIIPSTGENNILSPRLERKLARYGFVEYFARNFKAELCENYFLELETKAIELGDSSASNELILKIAHQLLTETNLVAISDDELDGQLSDALRAKSYGNQLMEIYIATLLNEVSNRKLVLTDENEATLTDRLVNPATEVLTKAAEEYNFYRFSMLPVMDAARKLSSMSSPVFEQYCSTLAMSGAGMEIIDCYYSEIVLDEETPTWEILYKVLEDSGYLTVHPKTEDKVGAMAWGLYCSELENAKTKVTFNISAVYSKYIDLMKLLLSSEELEKCSSIAKEEYWDQIDFSMVSFNHYFQYCDMDIDTEKCRCILSYCSLPQVLRERGEKSFFKASSSFFAENSATMSVKELDAAKERLAKEAKSLYIGGDSNFINWCNLFFCLSSDQLTTLLIDIYNDVNEKNTKYLFEDYQQFIVKHAYLGEAKDIVTELSRLLSQKCKQFDSERHPIALDMWLILGKNMFSNSFSIFDREKVEILFVDPYKVVVNSTLLEKIQYYDDAEDYIQAKGEEFKTVKKWLSELKQIEKQWYSAVKKSKKEESNQDKGIFKGLFGRK